MAIETLVKELWVLDPTTRPEPAEATMAPRLDTLEGKMVGLLDNGKPNSDRILNLVGEMLAKRYNLAGVVRRRKSNASKGVPQEIVDEMAEECDFAITGVGD